PHPLPTRRSSELVLQVQWSLHSADRCVRRADSPSHRLRRTESHMKTTSALFASAATVGFALLLTTSQARINAGQPPADTVPIDQDDLGGVVTSAKGPEAGVWVIAETTDLPTKFVKIVVTDDRGRYL